MYVEKYIRKTIGHCRFDRRKQVSTMTPPSSLHWTGPREAVSHWSRLRGSRHLSGPKRRVVWGSSRVSVDPSVTPTNPDSYPSPRTVWWYGPVCPTPSERWDLSKNLSTRKSPSQVPLYRNRLVLRSSDVPQGLGGPFLFWWGGTAGTTQGRTYPSPVYRKTGRCRDWSVQPSRREDSVFERKSVSVLRLPRHPGPTLSVRPQVQFEPGTPQNWLSEGERLWAEEE